MYAKPYLNAGRDSHLLPNGGTYYVVGPRFISIDTRSFPAGRLGQRRDLYPGIAGNIKTEMRNAKGATVRQVIQ